LLRLLGELATGIANYSPAASDWHSVKKTYARLFAAITAKRLLVPGAETWLPGGMVAGIRARTQGFQRHQRKELMNDALLFLAAAKAGLPVLTANRDQFDLIQQVMGTGSFIPYAVGRGA
jgi:hypothetical protein